METIHDFFMKLFYVSRRFDDDYLEDLLRDKRVQSLLTNTKVVQDFIKHISNDEDYICKVRLKKIKCIFLSSAEHAELIRAIDRKLYQLTNAKKSGINDASIRLSTWKIWGGRWKVNDDEVVFDFRA